MLNLFPTTRTPTLEVGGGWGVYWCSCKQDERYYTRHLGGTYAVVVGTRGPVMDMLTGRAPPSHKLICHSLAASPAR